MSEIKLDLSQPIDWNKNDLEYLMRDFDVVPGDDRRWYLWWPAEQTWIANFPDRASAERILSGDWTGYVGDPGWPRDDYDAVDVVGALDAYGEKHGRFPQIELDASSTLIELLTRIDSDLGLAFIGELIQIEDAVIELDPAVFHPLVAEHLAAGGSPRT
jgi:hypothetical protein